MHFFFYTLVDAAMRSNRGFLLLETMLYIGLSAVFVVLVHGGISGLLAALQTSSNQVRLLQQHASAHRLLVHDLRSASRASSIDELKTGIFWSSVVDANGIVTWQRVRWWVDPKGVVRRGVRIKDGNAHTSIIAQGCTALRLIPGSVVDGRLQTVGYQYQASGGMLYEAVVRLYNA